jgi:hypothetical protein
MDGRFRCRRESVSENHADPMNPGRVINRGIWSTPAHVLSGRKKVSRKRAADHMNEHGHFGWRRILDATQAFRREYL